MDALLTLAEFSNVFEIKPGLLKELLEQAGIDYLVANENARIVEPLLISPSNLSIEIKVFESDWQRAVEVLKSIE